MEELLRKILPFAHYLQRKNKDFVRNEFDTICIKKMQKFQTKKMQNIRTNIAQKIRKFCTKNVRKSLCKFRTKTAHKKKR